MKLSACVIVKNEEKNLPQWLSSMAQLADEMIVVDTGSEDNTKSLAHQAGAKVFDFTWIDDFAAAKNYAIEKASGDWILFLDADEYFAPEAVGKVREVIRKRGKNNRVAVLLCRLINIDRDRNNRVIDTFIQARIFRNLPSIRYAGRVHEQLTNTARQMEMVYTKDLLIYHTGYSTSIMQAKAKRNLPILLAQEAEAKDKKQKEKLYPYLADAYNSLGEYEKAIEYARYGIEAEVRHLGLEGHFYEIIIGSMQQLGYPHARIHEVLREARERYPSEIAFIIETGYFLWLDKDYLGAEKYLNQAIPMREKLERQLLLGEVSTDNSLRLLPFLYEAKADICYRKGDKKTALIYYKKCLEINKYAVSATKGFYKCIQEQDIVSVIELLGEFYQREQDSEYLLSVLAGRLSPELVAYYGIYAARDKQGEIFLQAGRYDSAAVEAARKVQRVNMLAAATCLAACGQEQNNFTQVAMSKLMAPQYAVCCNSAAAKDEQKIPLNVHRLLADVADISL